MTKLNLTLLCTLLCAATATATVHGPTPIYTETFEEMGKAGAGIPDTWHIYGKGGVPIDDLQGIFGTGTGPFYKLLKVDGKWGCWSNSSFRTSVEANEWLVTPPIHIESDAELLTFTTMATASSATSAYRVYVSETGFTKDDFDSAPIINSDIAGQLTAVSTKSNAVGINGFAGKDVYIAFVNRSKNAGMLGFTDIAIAPYSIKVSNRTLPVIPEGETFNISVDALISTPVNVSGIKATLRLADGREEIVESSIVLSEVPGTVTFTFPTPITMPKEGVDYTVTIQPNREGVAPTVLTDRASVPTTSYPPVMVMEEFTGTWCSWCPRGMAFINYYHDIYPGRDGKGKFIAIALHSGSNDPMQMSNEEYLTRAFSDAGAVGYPAAWFNRTTCADPSDFKLAAEMMAGKAYSRILFKRVDHDGSRTTPLEVKYAFEAAYDMPQLHKRLAFVVVENKLSGTSSEWDQKNSFSGISKQAAINTYGEDVGNAVWPYLEPYANSGSTKRANTMVYDHVARAIWPSYKGELMDGSYTTDEEYIRTVSIPIPEDVTDCANIAIIALVFDEETGRIVSADEIKATDFNRDYEANYVPLTDADTLHISADITGISAEGDGTVSLQLFGMDGSLLCSAKAQGRVTLPTSLRHGTYIVQAADAQCAKTLKVIL